MIKIYHNPRCKISRQVLERIKEKSSEEIQIRDYLKDNPDLAELKDLLVRLHLKPQEILRTQEKIYKEKLKNKQFSEEEWLQIIIENPKLIERPIVVKGNKAVLCRPPEKVEEIL